MENGKIDVLSVSRIAPASLVVILSLVLLQASFIGNAEAKLTCGGYDFFGGSPRCQAADDPAFLPAVENRLIHTSHVWRAGRFGKFIRARSTGHYNLMTCTCNAVVTVSLQADIARNPYAVASGSQLGRLIEDVLDILRVTSFRDTGSTRCEKFPDPNVIT